jgi:glutathione S-transferase
VSARARPVLWHIAISHYNEKARWALAYKGVQHSRRAVPGGIHMVLAIALTRGAHKTFPLLELDGERIGDSTAIIAALERRFPEPPLYPAGEAERRRALELEDWFDEELGPHVRLLAWHEVTRDRDRLEELIAMQLPGAAARGRRVAAAGATAFVNLRYGVNSDEAAELARGKVVAALDRLEDELGADGENLVGNRFGVADLTAAALLYPLVRPPEGPRLARAPEALERFREPLRERRAFRWVEDVYRRHRRHRPALERAAAAA